MAKEIVFDVDARDRLKESELISLAEKYAVKATLGPKGRKC